MKKTEFHKASESEELYFIKVNERLIKKIHDVKNAESQSANNVIELKPKSAAIKNKNAA